MKVGPTDRIVLLSEGASGGAAGVLGGGAVDAGSEPVVATEPFLAGAGVDFACGRDIFFEPSSVTMMSPCCSAAALSSTAFSASDQGWPAALQAQDGLNSCRNLNALGEDAYV